MYSKNRLIVAFMLLVFIALTVTGLISTLLINSQFDHYLAVEHERKLSNIFEYSTDALQGKGQMTLDEVGFYAVSENYYLEILNEEGQVVYASSNQIQQHMMGRHLTLAQMRNTPMYEDIGIENKPIEASDGDQYLIQVAFQGDLSVAKEAERFKSTLYMSILFSMLISVGVGLLMSFYFSKPPSSSITEAAQAAQAIAKGHLKTRLEADHSIIEVKQLHGAMNEMAQTLEEQEYLRRHVVDSVSHEVKTPLTVLKSHLEAFMDGVFKPDKKRFQNCYDEILRLEDLLARMDQVHDFNPQNYVMNLSRFDFVEETKNICQILKPQFDKKELKIMQGVPDKLLVEMDRYKLRQVFYNLLSNAYKFSTEGTTVVILIEEKEARVEVKVINQGLVIPHEEQERIFDLQYRGEEADTFDLHGKGLGLKITKDLVQFMEGELALIESNQNQTVFQIDLPSMMG